MAFSAEDMLDAPALMQDAAGPFTNRFAPGGSHPDSRPALLDMEVEF